MTGNFVTILMEVREVRKRAACLLKQQLRHIDHVSFPEKRRAEALREADIINRAIDVLLEAGLPSPQEKQEERELMQRSRCNPAEYLLENEIEKVLEERNMTLEQVMDWAP